jgi:hypothetical protein
MQRSSSLSEWRPIGDALRTVMAGIEQGPRLPVAPRGKDYKLSATMPMPRHS